MEKETIKRIRELISQAEGHIIDAQVEIKDAKVHLMDAVQQAAQALALIEAQEERDV